MLLFVGDDRSRSSSSTTTSEGTISTQQLQNFLQQLQGNAHSCSTQRNYLSVWRTFNKFIVWLDNKPNNWEDRLTLFVGFLVQNHRKSTTIKSYVSAVKAILLRGGIKLKEDRCTLNALTRACKLTVDKVKTKLPIHKTLLSILMKYLKVEFHDQPYLYLL